jgi:proteasome component ECM29
LSKRLSTLLPLVAKANSTHDKNVHLTTFTSIKDLFEGLSAEQPLKEEEIRQALEKILFQTSFEGLPEAMRMKRAEALVTVGQVNECGWIVEKVRPEAEGAERSAFVRGVLGKVGKK